MEERTYLVLIVWSFLTTLFSVLLLVILMFKVAEINRLIFELSKNSSICYKNLSLNIDSIFLLLIKRKKGEIPEMFLDEFIGKPNKHQES